MLNMLAADEVQLTNFVDRLSEIALKRFSGHIKTQLEKLVVHQVKQSVEQGTVDTVGQQIGHIATTTAARKWPLSLATYSSSSSRQTSVTE
jgi:hypothetical protein